MAVLIRSNNRRLPEPERPTTGMRSDLSSRFLL